MSERGFLSRWSQRKLASEQGVPVVEEIPTTPPEILPEETAGQGETPAIDEYVDEEIVAQLPDIETLDEKSDFSGFMQNSVPAELRKLALRKLWRSNPIFANLDGLNDYDEDFKTIVPLAEGVAEELKRLMKENSRDPQEDETEQGEESETVEASQPEEKGAVRDEKDDVEGQENTLNTETYPVGEEEDGDLME